MDKSLNWIEHIVEPDNLYLAWQAPDQMHDRFRWAVGVIAKEDNGYILRYLQDGSEFSELNSNRQYQELVDLGYRGYPSFPITRTVHRARILETFMRRLPPRKRTDFDKYLTWFGLRPDYEISDFALLGYTEAKLPSDGFSLVNPLPKYADRFEYLLDVAGYRYHDVGIHEGQSVEFIPESENLVDPYAVAVHTDNGRIGYVNRLQAKTFRFWINERHISSWIERIVENGRKPRVYVFLKVGHL